MSTRGKNLAILFFVSSGLVLAGRVYAATCASTASNLSSGDQALWNAHLCDVPYINFNLGRYDIQYGDWSDKGLSSAGVCDINQVYAKQWNATYLLDYATGNDNPWWNAGGRGFHYPEDYGGLAGHDSSGFHDGQRFLMPGYNSGLLGLYQTLFATPNRLNTYCGVYDNLTPPNGRLAGLVYASPDMRAAVMVHEGTHGWWRKIGTNGGNCGGHHCYSDFSQQFLQGTCQTNPGNCDFFYFHGTSKYARGALWYQDGKNGQGPLQYFHSPYQNQIEFLCDLVNNGQEWLPTVVLQNAENQANDIGTRNIINGPGIKCGTIKPW